MRMALLACNCRVTPLSTWSCCGCTQIQSRRGWRHRCSINSTWHWAVMLAVHVDAQLDVFELGGSIEASVPVRVLTDTRRHRPLDMRMALLACNCRVTPLSTWSCCGCTQIQSRRGWRHRCSINSTWHWAVMLAVHVDAQLDVFELGGSIEALVPVRVLTDTRRHRPLDMRMALLACNCRVTLLSTWSCCGCTQILSRRGWRHRCSINSTWHRAIMLAVHVDAQLDVF